jgi:hypothetical protein
MPNVTINNGMIVWPTNSLLVVFTILLRLGSLLLEKSPGTEKPRTALLAAVLPPQDNFTVTGRWLLLPLQSEFLAEGLKNEAAGAEKLTMVPS